MTRRAGLRLAAVIAAVLLLAFATVFATAPCTEGLDGDWAAAAIHGEVIPAGRWSAPTTSPPTWSPA